MNRIVSSLIVVTSLVAGLAWACATSPSGAGSIQGPALLHPGTIATFKLLEPGVHGQYEDRTVSAVWTVAPAATGRVEGPGIVSVLAPGPMIVTATLNGVDTTMSVKVLMPGQFKLSGTVRNEAGQPVAGATVTFQVGVNSYSGAVADATGAYSIANVAGPVTLIAEFLTTTTSRTIDVTGDTTGFDFTLAVPDGLVNLTGEWTATLAAPSSCASTLPAIARQRTYDVTISASDVYTFRFSSPTFRFVNLLEATSAGNGLNLPIPGSEYYGVVTGMLDQLGPGQWLRIVGAVTVPQLSAMFMTGVLAGQFDYYEIDPALSGPLITSIPNVRCAGTGTATFARTAAAPAGRRRR